MTTQEVADRYMELEKQGLHQQIHAELYADDCESIEPARMEKYGGTVYVKGRAAIKEKGDKFNATIEEMHGGHCGVPLVVGDFFSMAMGIDVTMKGHQRMKMDEIAVFEVKDGKIVKEQFFF